jgi:L-aspartate oxidase
MDRLFEQRRYLIPFRGSLLPQIFTDTLVIGAGVAGLRAGLAAASHGDTIVLAKGDLKTTNTSWAQGGIAAVTDDALASGTDDVESHLRDTLEAGAGLCEESVVRTVLEGAAPRIREMVEWGMTLDQDESGRVMLGREGGHSASRILHADGDATGREVQRTLVERARHASGLRLFERCFALDLITAGTEPGSPVMGAITHHPKHGLQVIWAKATILATGGAGVLYRETTNPSVATGDGLAMAYRAGASLMDMAFVQFHPTTLYLAGASRSLITEAIRGQGAHLLDDGGNRFMLDAHPLAELAPRDIVSQAIVRQIGKQGGQHVWLDCRHMPGVKARFPSFAALLKRFDLDPEVDLIPVHPAAHYMIGGVRTDRVGRTDVPGLYACGEAAANGLHGANRLASNSLLEGLVMGEVTGRICAEMRADARMANGHAQAIATAVATIPAGSATPPGWTARAAPITIISDIRPSDRGELDLSDVRSSLRSAMWKNVGIERTGARIEGCLEMIDLWARYTLDKIFDEPAGWETQNMLLVGALVARSALWRHESRGCHWRADVPSGSGGAGGSGAEFRAHDVWRKGASGPTVVPVGGPLGGPVSGPVGEPAALGVGAGAV